MSPSTTMGVFVQVPSVLTVHVQEQWTGIWSGVE